jgi:hypothetical protein
MGAALAGATCVALAASAAQLPGLGSGAKLSVRPASFSFDNGKTYFGGTDGKGPGNYGHIAWTGWTAKKATGKGDIWLYTCQPKCDFMRIPATVTAFRPVGGHFTRVTVRYENQGLHVTDNRSVARSGKHWVYSLIDLLAN